MPLAEALDILTQLADVLSAAHAAGVAHRDVKPANVMLCGERVILLDFGLATAENGSDEWSTPAGSLYGMAPEVILGSVRRGEGHLVDVYAFGALAHEVLTNVPPFPASTLNEVLVAHVNAELTPLPAYVPAPIADLVMELLAKEPLERPASMEAVLWQLRAISNRQYRTRRVLVVDDDLLLLDAVAANIRASFPLLEVEATGQAARALPVDGRPPADIVVVDLAMLDVNGLEVCMALRSLPRDRRPAIIVMSGSADEHDREVLASLDVDAFVPKDDKLLIALGDALARARLSAPSSFPRR